MEEKTIIEQLSSIEKELWDIKAEIADKKNLFCPGCWTLKNILYSLERTMNDIKNVKDHHKIDKILGKVESIEEIVVKSRVDDLRRDLDETTI